MHARRFGVDGSPVLDRVDLSHRHLPAGRAGGAADGPVKAGGGRRCNYGASAPRRGPEREARGPVAGGCGAGRRRLGSVNQQRRRFDRRDAGQATIAEWRWLDGVEKVAYERYTGS